MQAAKQLECRGLAHAPNQAGKGAVQLRAAQQRHQLFERKRWLRIDPLSLHERSERRGRITDLGIVDLAGTEQRTLAHGQTRQQRLRGARYARELLDEATLGAGEQVR